MAAKRMFANQFTESDDFISLSHSAQALYLHLSMRADDDGFINNTIATMRLLLCNKEVLNELVDSGMLIPFEGGVYVLRHWHQNNSIKKDRYTATRYQEEFKQLTISDNGVYTLCTSNSEKS